MDDAIEKVGTIAGPQSVIIAGVHGDEVCGVSAFKELLPTLSIERGTVTFLYGNPRAIAANTRLTETNLNRMFKPDTELTASERASYEYGRSRYIKTYLDKAEALLDVHASFTPESRRFAICEPKANGIAQYLPVDLVVSGFDALEPGGTDGYMERAGKIGLCIECGYLGDPFSTEIAKQAIVAFLQARGHIAGTPHAMRQNRLHMYDLYFTKTDNFVLAKPFADFEAVTRGQLIGMDGEEGVRAERDSVIVFAHNRSKTGEEAFLLGE